MANDNNETWAMEVMFSGKTHASATPWIFLECWGGDYLPNLGNNGFLGLEFRPGTDLETARAVVEMLNDHITHVTFTGSRRAWFNHIPGIGQKAREKQALGKVIDFMERLRRRGHPVGDEPPPMAG